MSGMLTFAWMCIHMVAWRMCSAYITQKAYAQEHDSVLDNCDDYITCDTLCEAKLQTVGWSCSVYSCDTECTDDGFLWCNDYQCACTECQRDCSLSEVDASACDIPPLSTEQGDPAEAILMAAGATAVAAASGAASAGGAALMGFGWELFDQASGGSGEAKLYNEIASLVDDRVDKLILCMDEKIALLEKENAKKAFKGVYELVDWAMKATGEKQEGHVATAFSSFEEQIAVHFDVDVTDAATKLEAMLPVFQSASALYSLVATAYLFDHMDDDQNYPVYKAKVDGTFQEFQDWIDNAKTIISSDKRSKLDQLPCRNGADMDNELTAWIADIDSTYIAPLQKSRNAVSRIDEPQNLENYKLTWSDNWRDIGDNTLFENAGAAQWYDCAEGEVMAGFFHHGWWSTTLASLESMRCVRPSVADASQDCEEQSISIGGNQFSGTFGCDGIGDGDYLLRGIYSAANPGNGCALECWTKLKCCRYTSSKIMVSSAGQGNQLWQCLAAGGAGQECAVDEDEFIQSFWKNVYQSTDWVQNLHSAFTKTLYTTTPSYRYLGCFLDKLSGGLGRGTYRTMPVHNVGEYTVDGCSAQCKAYSYFALTEGSVCYCGDSYEDATVHGVSTSCSLEGTGGGLVEQYTWSLSLYRQSRWVHLGCFQDSWDRALNDVEHGYGFTVKRCSAQCDAYTYFSVQDNSQCFCDNSYDDATKHGTSTGCSNGIGGSMAHDLYQHVSAKSAYFQLDDASSVGASIDVHPAIAVQWVAAGLIALVILTAICVAMNIWSACKNEQDQKALYGPVAQISDTEEDV